MAKRLLLLTLLSGLAFISTNAQYFLGLRSSAFGGVTNVDYNPAIADNPFLLDINLISMGATVNNNYLGISRQFLLHPNQNSGGDFQSTNLLERVNGKPKDVYIGAQVMGPLSFMVSFGKKGHKNQNAFAFSYHLNAIFNIDNLDQTLARSAYYGLGQKADSVTSFLNKPLSNANVAIKAMTWMDYDFTYSRVVLEKGAHMLKVGGTIKLLQGLQGLYFYANNLQYKWPNFDTLSLFKTNVNYAYSTSIPTSQNYSVQTISSSESAMLSYVKDIFSFKYSSPSVGVDLGATYEWRPDLDKYKYQMDCEDQWRYDKSRYKLAAGFSIMDIGAVTFKRGQYSENINADIQNWNVHNIAFPNGIQSFDDTLRSRFQVLQSTKSTFTMWLPTRFNLFLDYNIGYGFGANLSGTISPNLAQDRNMVHQVSTFSLTPKYDWSYFGIYLPLSYDVMGNFDFGATIRIGPLTIGTSDLLGLFAKKWVYNADVHMGLKITIPYHKLRDRDGDGVSNKKDKCPKEKGPCATHGCPDRDGDGVLDKDDRCPDQPGPVSLHGCPDSDSDGIADIDDSCPFNPGPLKYHGCPDRDSDGIIDKYDECPDQPGLPQFNGCPDRDSDGVPDKLDLCPDLPGSKEHHGCPDTDGDGVFDDEDQCINTPGPKENHGCPWPDRDGDGIPDKDDACPDVFGVPENNGCPKLEKKEIETIKYAFENLEFETAKDVIRTHSYASLNALANLLISKASYGLRIDGHTDNVGTDERNLILSQKRADAVKKYLVKRGVDAAKLETHGYGASKPIADNIRRLAGRKTEEWK